jgi:hypothetical protein
VENFLATKVCQEKKKTPSLLRIEKLISTDDKILIFSLFLFLFLASKRRNPGAAS